MTTAELEIDKINQNFTEKLLRSETKLIDLTYVKITNYIKCTGVTIEKIDDRLRIAFFRCPSCRKYMSLYKDEVDSRGRTVYKKCTCGLNESFLLEKWKN